MSPRHPKPLHVLKFGGTSLGDAERIRQACLRAIASARRQPSIVVVSAMAGTTNLLLDSARLAAAGDSSSCRRALVEIRSRHCRAAQTLLPDHEQCRLTARLDEVLADFAQSCGRFSQTRRVTPRGLDRIGGLGELLSAELVAATLKAAGQPAEAVDSCRLIVTDGRYGDAKVLLAPTRARLRRRLLRLLASGTIPVVTGFRGATLSRIPTTLGRGSSDYTATLIAALVGATHVTIWTDVDGVMTADPKLAPSAGTIPRLSFDEAVELAFFGGKVIHWKAMLPLMKSGIPLQVRNSLNPGVAGTRIVPYSRRRAAVAAVSALVPVHLVTVHGEGGIGPVDLTRRVLRWLDAHQSHPLLFLQSSTENAVALALGREDIGSVVRLVSALSRGKRSQGVSRIFAREVGLVAAIGGNIRHAPAVVSRVYTAIARRHIEIFASATGPSGQAVAVAIRPDRIASAVLAIHSEFHLHAKRRSRPARRPA